MTLKRNEKNWLANWQANRVRPVMPGALAATLPRCLADFRDAFPGSAASNEEVKAGVVAAIYGPQQFTPVPDTVVTQLAGASGFASLSDVLACESSIVWACRLPFASPFDWDHCWLGAWDALLHVIQDVIRDAVKWFGKHTAKVNASNLNYWSSAETQACAALLRGCLIRGCKCWERDDDFHAVNGIVNCCGPHDLANWKPAESSLFQYIWRGAVAGKLSLSKNGACEQAMTNAARKGMLARCICDGNVDAGPVLKCKQDGCVADVQLNDVCGNGHGIHPIHDPTWWFWLKGERIPWRARRCLRRCGCSDDRCDGKKRDAEDCTAKGCDTENCAATGCDGLYFQHNGQCPHCSCPGTIHATTRWSPRPTQVWVPADFFREQGDLDSPLTGEDLTAARELLDALSGDAKAFVERWLKAWNEDEEGFIHVDSEGIERESLLHEINFVRRQLDLIGTDEWQRRKRVIESLSGSNKPVGVLRYLRGQEMADIATKLGMSVKEVGKICRQLAVKLSTTITE